MPKGLKFLYFLLITSILFDHSAYGQTTSALQKSFDNYRDFFDNTDEKPTEDLLRLGISRLNNAIEINNAKSIAKAQKELGLIYLTRLNDFQKAMEYFIKSMAIEDSLSLKESLVITNLAIAQIFEEVEDYPNSKDYLNQAKVLNTSFNNDDIDLYILNKLGKINASNGYLKEALINYNEVIEKAERLKHYQAIGEALLNLGQLHRLDGAYLLALEKHKEALEIQRSLKDRSAEAYNLSNIGELYYIMRNYDRSLANHIASLEIFRSLKNTEGIAMAYNYIGVLYFNQYQIERAIANLKLGLENAQEVQAQVELRKSYKFLSQCYREIGNFQQALNYQDLYVAFNDFIQNEKNESKLIDMQNRYILEKKQTQIDKLELNRIQRENELKRQKRSKDFLMILAGLAIIIGVLVLYLYLTKRKSNKVLAIANRKVQKQNDKLQEVNATKDKFFSIIGHDLKGPLNSLTSFSGLLINHTESLSKEEIKMLATDLDKSLKNLFALLENLLEWSRSQTGNIDFTPEKFNIRTLLENNVQLLEGQAQNKGIKIVNDAPETVMAYGDQNSITTVIRNLISNAIKFTPENGMIKVAAKATGSEVKVAIADNGVGMSEEVMGKIFRIDAKHSTTGTANEKGTGLGLLLCKEFIEKNGGEIWVKSKEEKGSVFYFTIPTPK